MILGLSYKGSQNNMKIKRTPVSLFNKKKSNLPQSKLLKSKVLKHNTNTLKNQKIDQFEKQKLSLAINNTDLSFNITKPQNKNKKQIQHVEEAEKNGKDKISLKTKAFKSNSVKLKEQNTGTNVKQQKSDIMGHKNKDKFLKTPLKLDKANNGKIKKISNILFNKKNDILSQSKLLNKTKFKHTTKTLNNKLPNKVQKDKLSLAINETELTSHQIKPKKKILKNKKNIQDLKKTKNVGKRKISLKANASKSNSVLLKKQKAKRNLKQKKINVKVKRNKKKKFKTPLKLDKVTNAVAALLKLVNKDTNALLTLPDPIFMEVECIKIPILNSTKQLRFNLPHSVVDELSDVLLITADKKGAKIYPGKAVDHYTELLEKHGINFIQKVIPLRSLREEYSQYEMRRKLVDQYDIILAENKIIKSLPSKLGKFIMYNRKMPIPVKLDCSHLKEHLLSCIKKTQMTVKGTGQMSIVQVGHTKMTASHVAKNIIAISKSLNPLFPGGWKNIRSLDIKTPKSIKLPVYLSLVLPNSVKTPTERPEVPEKVEGELSTMLGKKVIVRADGTVYLEDMEEDEDDSVDDEILADAKKYYESSKTVRHDENSDSDNDAVTTATEKKLLQNYNKKIKDEENEDEEEEEEEEEEDDSNDEDEPVAPVLGQKRKRNQKKQDTDKSPSKKQKKAPQKGKLKEKLDKKVDDESGPPKIGIKRGSRGGKKNKLSKPQRKGLLKKKKSWKK